MLINNLDSKNHIDNGYSICKNNSRTLIVAFGGIKQGLGIPQFEFFNILKNFELDKIFLRDSSQVWYQKGINNKINSIYKLANWLDNFIKNANYDKIIFIGNSMGGYISILLGTMLNIDTIISSSPQTFVDKINRVIKFDFRWSNQISKIYKNQYRNLEFLDLKKYLQINSDYNTKINIYFNGKHRLDNLHAKRLSNIKGVILNPLSVGGHNVIRILRDDGKLKHIIENELE